MEPGKTIYLLELDKDEWVWCDDPDPDTCPERRVLEYKLVGEYKPDAESD